MGKLLETALVVAIVAEAGVAGYIYRDKIADFINSRLNPKVETVASPISNNSIIEEPSTETPEGTATETETPVPSFTALPENNNNSNGQTPIQPAGAVSTPAPTDDKPGLHLGQTKQPTSEPNSDTKNNNKKN